MAISPSDIKVHFSNTLFQLASLMPSPSTSGPCMHQQKNTEPSERVDIFCYINFLKSQRKKTTQPFSDQIRFRCSIELRKNSFKTLSEMKKNFFLNIKNENDWNFLNLSDRVKGQSENIVLKNFFEQFLECFLSKPRRQVHLQKKTKLTAQWQERVLMFQLFQRSFVLGLECRRVLS